MLWYTLTELDLKDYGMQYIVCGGAAVGHPQLFSHHRDGSDIGKGEGGGWAWKSRVGFIAETTVKTLYTLSPIQILANILGYKINRT